MTDSIIDSFLVDIENLESLHDFYEPGENVVAEMEQRMLKESRLPEIPDTTQLQLKLETLIPVAPPLPAIVFDVPVDVSPYLPYTEMMRQIATRVKRKHAIRRWQEKRKRRLPIPIQHPEFEIRRQAANKRPRINGRFIPKNPKWIPVSELAATQA